MNMDYYYKDGTPILGDFPDVTHIWGELHSDLSYRRIDDTHVFGYRVSTVWLGMDHSFDDKGPPIIFETMVFRETSSGTDFDEAACERYATEQEAIDGHNLLVEQIKTGLFVPYGSDQPEYFQIDEELLP